jgi:hypothetical protein
MLYCLTSNVLLVAIKVSVCLWHTFLGHMYSRYIQEAFCLQFSFLYKWQEVDLKSSGSASVIRDRGQSASWTRFHALINFCWNSTSKPGRCWRICLIFSRWVSSSRYISSGWVSSSRYISPGCHHFISRQGVIISLYLVRVSSSRYISSGCHHLVISHQGVIISLYLARVSSSRYISSGCHHLVISRQGVIISLYLVRVSSSRYISSGCRHLVISHQGVIISLYLIRVSSFRYISLGCHHLVISRQVVIS